jgi:hydroxymethylpyrimidine pyrophosphatase-like HAD family hydrolase
MFWNTSVKLIISDVDETIADNYLPANPEMIAELTSLLEEGKVLFMVTGASIQRIKMRITDFLPAHLRKNVLAAHCSGAEVWGFTNDGELRDTPFYTLYEGAMTGEQKTKWRDLIQQLISEFKLKTHEPMGAVEFMKQTNSDPLAVILEDRGPQITFEFINSYDMSVEQEKQLEVSVPQTHGNYDLRIPVLARAQELFNTAGIPITPRLAGQWAIDFALQGVNKTTAVKTILENEEILSEFGLTKADVNNPENLEIWGDKFSAIRGGTDRHMCEAVSPEVRAIDFREENSEEFPKGFNIVLWDGNNHLHHGLQEYLQSRHNI